MTAVVALIHGEAGAYGISFPDFPGCASGGASLDEALRRGREALATHIEAMRNDHEPSPTIRDLDTLRDDPKLREDFADATLVTAVDLDLPGKAVRVNISMEEALLARIDREAKARGESRSRYLAEAARKLLAS